MRITVGTVVGLLAAGRTRDEILGEYSSLEAEDIAVTTSIATRERTSMLGRRHKKHQICRVDINRC